MLLDRWCGWAASRTSRNWLNQSCRSRIAEISCKLVQVIVLDRGQNPRISANPMRLSAPRTLAALLLSLAAAVPALVLGVILSEWIAVVPVIVVVLVLSGTLLGGWAGAPGNTRQRAKFAGTVGTLAWC
jgi:hypothetical protein